MDKAKNQLGIMMAQNRLYFVEATPGRALRLVSAGAMDMDVAFDFPAFADTEVASRFADAVQQMIDRFAISANALVFCLDRRLVQLKRIKIDRELEELDLRQQVEWELEQMLLSPRGDYHADYERIRFDRDRFDYVLIAIVRKAIIDYLARIFSLAHLRLERVDIDLLGSIRALPLFNLEPKGLTVLVDSHQNSLGITLIKNQSYLSYGELTRPAGQSGQPEDAEELATRINDEIGRLLENQGDEVLLKSIEEIYFTTNDLPVEVPRALERLQRAARITILNPLEHIDHSLSLEAEQVIRENLRHLLPLLGLLKA